MEQSIARLILNDNHSANRADELIWITVALPEERWSAREQWIQSREHSSDMSMCN